MKKIFFAATTICVLMLAVNCAAPQEVKTREAVQPATVQISTEGCTDMLSHLKTMQLGGADWEKSAKVLEGKYGAASLPALVAAREFSTNQEFKQRCSTSITRIEKNIAEGLQGGRSKNGKD